MKMIARTALMGAILSVSICANAQLSQSWAERYNGTANGLDQAKAIATDKQGNTYVTGRSTETGAGPAAITTIKYSPTGARLWRESWFNQSHSGEDVGNDIAVDNDGNAYVTGYTTTSNGTTDLVVLKLRSSDGFVLWATQYDYPGFNSHEEGVAIALGQNGYVYVGGYTDGLQLAGSHFLVIALDPATGSLVPGWQPKVWSDPTH